MRQHLPGSGLLLCNYTWSMLDNAADILAILLEGLSRESPLSGIQDRLEIIAREQILSGRGYEKNQFLNDGPYPGKQFTYYPPSRAEARPASP